MDLPWQTVPDFIKENKMAVKTEYHKWKGKVSFCKIHPDNPDNYNGVKKWVINFHPQDEDTWKAIEKSGSQRKVVESTKRKPNKAVDEWGEYIRLDRPVEKEFKKGEGPKPLAPVKVTGIDDFDPREWFNGSTAEVEVEIYGNEEWTGTRLVGVDFIDLIVYDPEAKKQDEEPSNETKEASKEPKAPWL